jgi:hypothetical protein
MNTYIMSKLTAEEIKYLKTLVPHAELEKKEHALKQLKQIHEVLERYINTKRTTCFELTGMFLMQVIHDREDRIKFINGLILGDINPSELRS